MTYKPQNPFIVGRYVSPEFFCDRIEETATLTKHLTNGRNVALISPRRMGKSGLIEHTFGQAQIQEQYYTFFIDIYGTRSFSEMVYLFANNIYNQLKPRNTQWKERFFQVIRSLQAGVKFDNLSAPPHPRPVIRRYYCPKDHNRGDFFLHRHCRQAVPYCI